METEVLKRMIRLVDRFVNRKESLIAVVDFINKDWMLTFTETSSILTIVSLRDN